MFRLRGATPQSRARRLREAESQAAKRWLDSNPLRRRRRRRGAAWVAVAEWTAERSNSRKNNPLWRGNRKRRRRRGLDGRKSFDWLVKLRER